MGFWTFGRLCKTLTSVQSEVTGQTLRIVPSTSVALNLMTSPTFIYPFTGAIVKESSRTTGTITRIVASSKIEPDPGVESIAKIVNSFIYLPVCRIVAWLCPHINVLHFGSLALVTAAAQV